MSEHYDDLDAYIAKRSTKNPAFPTMVDAALKQRRLLRELAAKRVERELSQKMVAALMGTTQPALARLERGEIDPKLSTLERYAEALGRSIAVIGSDCKQEQQAWDNLQATPLRARAVAGSVPPGPTTFVRPHAWRPGCVPGPRGSRAFCPPCGHVSNQRTAKQAGRYLRNPGIARVHTDAAR